jgi:hypothetical protein
MHKKCHAQVIAVCPGAVTGETTRVQSDKILTSRFQINVPHSFKTHSYMRPTFCDHCGSLLWGVVRQGQQCKSCKFNVHKKCAKHVGNLCGLDQRSLGEELVCATLSTQPSTFPSSKRAILLNGSLLCIPFACLRLCGRW